MAYVGQLCTRGVLVANHSSCQYSGVCGMFMVASVHGSALSEKQRCVAYGLLILSRHFFKIFIIGSGWTFETNLGNVTYVRSDITNAAFDRPALNRQIIYRLKYPRHVTDIFLTCCIWSLICQLKEKTAKSLGIVTWWIKSSIFNGWICHDLDYTK